MAGMQDIQPVMDPDSLAVEFDDSIDVDLDTAMIEPPIVVPPVIEPPVVPPRDSVARPRRDSIAPPQVRPPVIPLPPPVMPDLKSPFDELRFIAPSTLPRRTRTRRSMPLRSPRYSWIKKSLLESSFVII